MEIAEWPRDICYESLVSAGRWSGSWGGAKVGLVRPFGFFDSSGAFLRGSRHCAPDQGQPVGRARALCTRASATVRGFCAPLSFLPGLLSICGQARQLLAAPPDAAFAGQQLVLD